MKLQLLIILRCKNIVSHSCHGALVAGLSVALSFGIIAALSSQLSVIPATTSASELKTSRCFAKISEAFSENPQALMPQLFQEAGCAVDGWSAKFHIYTSPKLNINGSTSTPAYVLVSAGSDHKLQTSLEASNLNLSNDDLYLILQTPTRQTKSHRSFAKRFLVLQQTLRQRLQQQLPTDSVSDLQLPTELLVDRWGQMFQLKHIDTQVDMCQLVSAGPDEQFETSDDCTWSIYAERTSPENARVELQSSSRVNSASYVSTQEPVHGFQWRRHAHKPEHHKHRAQRRFDTIRSFFQRFAL